LAFSSAALAASSQKKKWLLEKHALAPSVASFVGLRLAEDILTIAEK
jgi:hypothetical protein